MYSFWGKDKQGNLMMEPRFVLRETRGEKTALKTCRFRKSRVKSKFMQPACTVPTCLYRACLPAACLPTTILPTMILINSPSETLDPDELC